MFIIDARNAGEALETGLDYLRTKGVVVNTRAGEALTAPEPVCTFYTRPEECIIDSDVRRANPFFHLVESFWLLAGRDDTKLLDRYISTFGSRFADNGILWGSYGKRWRSQFGVDQLHTIINKLKADPTTRQAVLQMWSAELDLPGGKGDHPCNTAAYFRIRPNGLLDMTVTNRSNDALMGLWGANAVQFSFLLRYIAESAGLRMGRYIHISNDLHVYTKDLQAFDSRGKYTPAKYCGTPAARIVDYAPAFDEELAYVLHCIDTGKTPRNLTNIFLEDTLFRSAAAHALFKQGNIAAALILSEAIGAEDWRVACTNWIKRHG